jgi:hypothetical protein
MHVTLFSSPLLFPLTLFSILPSSCPPYSFPLAAELKLADSNSSDDDIHFSEEDDDDDGSISTMAVDHYESLVGGRVVSWGGRKETVKHAGRDDRRE